MCAEDRWQAGAAAPAGSAADQTSANTAAQARSSGNAPAGRWNRGAWLFRDETLQRLETLLDEAFRVPGTQFRFGLDGVIGLVPALGDVLAGLLSAIIPIAAWARGVPYIALLRMAVNLGIGVLVGTIPIFGDIFDVAWKPNRRNLRLLHRHLSEPRRHTWRDWVFLLLLAAGLALIFAIPLFLVFWLIAWLLTTPAPPLPGGLGTIF